MQVTDPVCDMKIDDSEATGKSEYNGKTYYFCSKACKIEFDEDPKKFVKA